MNALLEKVRSWWAQRNTDAPEPEAPTEALEPAAVTPLTLTPSARVRPSSGDAAYDAQMEALAQALVATVRARRVAT